MHIRLRFEEYDEDFKKFTGLFKEDKDVMTQAAKNIAEDIKVLVKRLFEERCSQDKQNCRTL